MNELTEAPQLDVVVTGEAVLSPAELEAIIEAEREAERVRLQKLAALVVKLCAKRDEAIRAKRDVEQSMSNSLRLYHGMDRLLSPTKQFPTSGGPDNDRNTKPGLLRARIDRWEARIVDMISANPWDLEPEESTQQVSADAMRAVVEEQLGACNFERSLRRMSQDAARLGTGLLMGPMSRKITKRRYVAGDGVTGTSGMVSTEEDIPEIREGDPWFFYPDPVDKAERAEYAFYAHLLSPIEVRQLSPGFDESQIAALLNSEPDLGELATSIADRNRVFNRNEQTSGKYAVWRYTGVLERDELEVLGCTCDETGEDGNTTMPPMAMADVWFSQNFVLRARLSPLSDDTRIPYFVFAPFSRDDSMFGTSLAELGEGSQRSMESLWASALHNQSVSSGPLFLWRSGKIKFPDNQASIRGPKMLEITDSDAPIGDNFAVETVPNVIESALVMIDRAIANMDEELNTSQWASHDRTSEQQTASGLAMIMNANSIFQVRVACTADDEVFRPVIDRMVWWNNDYHDDPTIKGNYLVKPSVQSQRLVKDVQVQQQQAFAQFVLADPMLRARMDESKILRDLAAQIDAPVSEWILPDDEYQAKMQEQAQQPDPMRADAEYKMAKAETERVKAQTEALKAQRELLESQRPPEADHGAVAEYQLKARDLELKERDIQARLAIAQMREESTRLIAAVRTQENRIKADQLAQDRREARTAKLTEAGMKMERDAQEMAIKRQLGSGI